MLLAAAAPLTNEVQKAPEQQQAAANPAPAAQKQAAPASVGIASRQTVAERKAAAAQHAKNGVELGSWPDWVIVAFTLILMIVAILQHRLEARMGRETVHALAISKQAADAATASAEAATKTVEIAAATALKELRPYVYIMSPDDPEPVTRYGNMFIAIKNYGRTPALAITTQDCYGYFVRPYGDAVVDLQHPPEPIPDLAPGEFVPIGFALASISDADFEGVRSGKGVVLLRIKVEYEYAPGLRDSQDVTVAMSQDGLARGILSTVSPYDRQLGPQQET